LLNFFKKNYILILKLFILIPVILLYLVLRLFLKIKIGKIETNLFGHLLPQTDIFICENYKKLYKNLIVIWFTDKIICNKYILNKFKKHLIILPRHILEPVNLFFSYFNFKEYLNYYYFDKKHNLYLYGKKEDNYNLIKEYPSPIEFTEVEINRGLKMLKSFGLDKNDKFVCFSSRSGNYKNEKFIAVKNSNIDNQKKGINFLINKGYKALRLGKNHTKKIKWASENIIDITTDNDENDFINLYALSKCEFFISSGGGVAYMGSLMRKHRLLIDYFKFSLLYHEHLDFTPMLIPKKIYSLKNKSFLKYSESFQSNIFELDIVDQLDKLGLKLVDNTQDEIEMAIYDMYLYNEKKLDLMREKEKQKHFWKKYKDTFKFDTKNLIICPSFFDKNKELF
tara:strand:- start:444 stop:1631 length:1188 start_codon:yes stop_codon:yes gene_type:complete